MEGVQFTENSYKPALNSSEAPEKTSRFAAFLVKNEIASDKKQANVILLIFAGITLLISVFVFARMTGEPSVSSKPYSELTEEEKLAIPVEQRALIEKPLLLNNQ